MKEFCFSELRFMLREEPSFLKYTGLQAQVSYPKYSLLYFICKWPSVWPVSWNPCYRCQPLNLGMRTVRPSGFVSFSRLSAVQRGPPKKWHMARVEVGMGVCRTEGIGWVCLLQHPCCKILHPEVKLDSHSLNPSPQLKSPTCHLATLGETVHN